MAESTKELTAEGATVVTTAEGSSATAAPPTEPKKLLVALTTGPTTDPSKCALAFLVASKAAAAGHGVSMFLASDGVQCLTDDVISSLEGVGTGKLSETYPACVAAGVTFYVSGMSCKARGITFSQAAIQAVAIKGCKACNLARQRHSPIKSNDKLTLLLKRAQLTVS